MENKMKEYEYSFEVKRLNEILKYLEKNDYIKESENFQERTIYENQTNTTLRVTKNNINDDQEIILDFKTKKNNFDKVLNISKESLPLKIKKEESKILDSIIDILEYKECKNLVRKRYIYKKEKVIFELDEYTLPKIAFIVAIEGEPGAVDKAYKDVQKNL
jgi:adenylate cyclase class IV